MIHIPLPDMIARLQEKTGLSEDEIKQKIEDKCKALSGLISKEGAAHILANELGVKLLDQSSGKIKDLYPGMRNAEVTGTITQKYDVREFSRADGSKGQVGSFMVGDDTGMMRIVCWGDQTKLMSPLSEGMGVKITNGQVRENQRGYKEVHLSSESKINEASDAPKASPATVERKAIKDLQEGQSAEIMGTVVQIFDPRYFEVCSDCSKRLKEQDGQWVCSEHGSDKIDYGYLMNVFLDDGSESIRVVMFRDQVEKILNKSKQDVLSYRGNPELFEPMKTELLGEQFKFSGRAKNNDFFNRIEFVANSVAPASAEEELSRLNSP